MLGHLNFEQVKIDQFDQFKLLNLLDLPCMFYLKDKAGTILDCNHYQALVLNAQSIDNVVGKNGYDFFIEDSARMIAQNDAMVIASKKRAFLIERANQNLQCNDSTASFKFPCVNKKGVTIGIAGISFPLSGQDDVGLSPQQKQCLYYLTKGMTFKQIGAKLNLSPRTIENYIYIIKDKLNCVDRASLVEKALTLPFISLQLFLNTKFHN